MKTLTKTTKSLKLPMRMRFFFSKHGSPSPPKKQEMQLHKLLPSVVSFNSCITALAFGGRWMEALDLFVISTVGMQLQTLVLRSHALLVAMESLDVFQNPKSMERQTCNVSGHQSGPIFFCACHFLVCAWHFGRRRSCIYFVRLGQEMLKCLTLFLLALLFGATSIAKES